MQQNMEISYARASAGLGHPALKDGEGASVETEPNNRAAKKRSSQEALFTAATIVVEAASSPNDHLVMVQYDNRLEGVLPLPPVYVSPRSNKKPKKGGDHDGKVDMNISEFLAGSRMECRRDQ